jgi:hypothetical protein
MIGVNLLCCAAGGPCSSIGRSCWQMLVAVAGRDVPPDRVHGQHQSPADLGFKRTDDVIGHSRKLLIGLARWWTSRQPSTPIRLADPDIGAGHRLTGKPGRVAASAACWSLPGMAVLSMLLLEALHLHVAGSDPAGPPEHSNQAGGGGPAGRASSTT